MTMGESNTIVSAHTLYMYSHLKVITRSTRVVVVVVVVCLIFHIYLRNEIITIDYYEHMITKTDKLTTFSVVHLEK